MLKDSYKKYQNIGFILQKAVEHKKHAFRKGSYKDRENEPFSEKATGYVGVIPKGVIIIDNDKYQDNGASMGKFIKDLGRELIPFAITPSGGEHYAIYNQYPEKIIGNIKKKYPHLDIYAGYQSVIPIVGTTVYNKQGELASYKWADDFEEFIVNEWSEDLLELLAMRDRAEAREVVYDGLSTQIKADDMSEEEVYRLLDSIPSNIDYDTWLSVGMCLYDRFEGSEEGLKAFLYFGEKSDKDDADFTTTKWENGHLIPTSITYKTLRTIASEFKLTEVYEKIKTLSSADEVEALIEELSESDNSYRARGKTKEEVTLDIGNKLNQKLKELQKEDKSIKVIQARTISKTLLNSAKEEVKSPSDCKLYLCSNKYTIQSGTIVENDVVSTSLAGYLSNLGVKNKDEVALLKENVTAIDQVKYIPDYLLDCETVANVEKNDDVTKFPNLVVRTNPLIDVGDYIHDDEIINDFVYGIWNGKIEDIVELIALTIKAKEQKLNRLMLVAPSNSGKSYIFDMMKFQKITMSRLLNGMRGNKGIGADIVKGLKKSALLLIDEANSALEAEIKDMDKELHIDQFGTGGTQILPLHFTALTSTHKTATRNNSDELYNRFLQIELTKDEMKHTIMGSEIFLRDSEYYSKVIKSYLLSRFRQTILSDKGEKELRVLQDKYRLPINNDLDILLFDISQLFIKQTKLSAVDNGEVFSKNDVYFYKKKHDVSEFFKDQLKEIPAIDVGKYQEILTDHFVDKERVSVRSDNGTIKAYKVNLIPYTTDENELIISQFDNLNEFDI
jgi:hypothetical protein